MPCPLQACSRAALVAAFAAGFLVNVGAAVAQQQAQPPASDQTAPAPAAQAPAPSPAAATPGQAAQAPIPPPSWQRGRPEAEPAVKLAPVPAPPIAASP